MGKETEPLSRVTDPKLREKLLATALLTARNIADKLGLNPDSYLLAQGTLHTDLMRVAQKLPALTRLS